VNKGAIRRSGPLTRREEIDFPSGLGGMGDEIEADGFICDKVSNLAARRDSKSMGSEKARLSSRFATPFVSAFVILAP
jgi:hypothetical protein